jgi:hypothetical protein
VRRQPAGAWFVEVGQYHAFEVTDDGPQRDGYLQVVPAAAVFAFALAVDAGGGTAVRVVFEGQQRSDVVVDRQPDVTASAAIAAVGPTSGDVSLAAKGHRARAAVTRLYMDLALVNEHKRLLAAL